MQSQGHQVVLVSLFKGDGQLIYSGKQIHLNLNAKVRWLHYSGFKAFAQVIRNEKPEIVQANAGDTLKYAVLSRLLFGWKQPIVFRNASMVSLYIKNPIIKKLNGFLYSKVDAIASVSHQSKLDLNQLFPITKIKSKVIPIGIEQAVGAQRRSREERSGIEENEIQLVHVGGFSFEKNHKGLLNIFKRFLVEYPNSTLKLVGDGPLRTEVEEQAKFLGIGESIEFLGFQTNPMPYVSESDIFVLPSIIEGLPGVVLEAFDCKTPVVAYEVGGVGEVVINGKTGILVKKNDEEAFLQAMIETLEKPGDTQERVKNANELVRTEFRNEVIAKKFIEFYNGVLNSQSVPTDPRRL